MRQYSRRVLLLCVTNACIIILVTVYLRRHAKGNVASQESTRKELRGFLRVFGELFTKVKICVIEPRILWNLLTENQRRYLIRKGFNIEKYGQTRNVLSVAISHEDVKKLRKEIETSRSWHPYWEVKAKAEPWMNQTHTENGFITSHILLRAKRVFLFVSVHYARGNYFWSKKLQKGRIGGDLPASLLDKLPYGHYDAAYHRYHYEPYSVGDGMPQIYYPRSAGKFLFQLQTSRFISCLGIQTRISSGERNETDPYQVPYWFFKKTTVDMIRKLEYFTDDSLSQFWLASGTLLGWYRDCGLIPYTNDIDFSAWAEDLTFELIALIQVDEHVHLLQKLGQPTEDFELWLMFKWLRVDLFFTYEDKENGVYYMGGHRPEQGYSFRYRFPKFKLCTGDFLERRVLVPCNPEAVLEAEYGKSWKTPMEYWDYELSARNIVGRRYWSDEEIRRFMAKPEPKSRSRL